MKFILDISTSPFCLYAIMLSNDLIAERALNTLTFHCAFSVTVRVPVSPSNSATVRLLTSTNGENANVLW